MNKQERAALYSRINQLAGQLDAIGEHFTRADLAKELGIKCDDDNISLYVSEAYESYGNSDSIRKAFITNDERDYVVDSYSVSKSLYDGKREAALSVTQSYLDASCKSLNKLHENVNSRKLIVEHTERDYLSQSSIEGHERIDNLQKSAYETSDNYMRLIDSYRSAESYVKADINNFTALRTDVVDLYRDYATRLVDVFGDSIRAVQPDLFDFGSIGWLDVDAMFYNVQFEINALQENLAVFSDRISQSFYNTAQEAANTYQNTGGGWLGAISAGVQIAAHYSQADQITRQMQSQFERVKAMVYRDATTINGDMGRLIAIYKSLNDVATPKANAFIRYANQLLNSDYAQVEKAVYDQPGVKELCDRRKMLTENLRGLDETANDHIMQVAIFQSQIAQNDPYLSSRSRLYKEAIDHRPSRMPALISALLLFLPDAKYVEDRTKWRINYGDMVDQYEKCLVETTLAQDELEDHKKALQRLHKQREALVAEIDNISQQIRAKIVVSDSVRETMVKHLRPLVAMLRLGREIAETKLDENLTSAVQFPDRLGELQLPEELDRGISKISSCISEHAYISNPMGSMKTELANQVIQAGVQYAERAVRYQILRMQGEAVAQEYEADLQMCREQFAQYISQIDDKSACIREILRQVNLASSPDEQREALLLLSEASGTSLSESDVDAFLRGDTTITL